ncbi:MAG: hypothetical protein AAF483_31185, partial [Planctomycetota bacterium]
MSEVKSDDAIFEDDNACEQPESKSWVDRLREFASSYPDYVLILLGLTLNFVILSFVTGYGMEPSRFIHSKHLEATPFGGYYYQIDAIVLAILTSQLSMVMFWSIASRKRMLLCRLTAFCCMVVVYMIVLQATVNPQYQMQQLVTFFACFSLGTALAAIDLRIRRWRISTRNEGELDRGKFAMSELLVLATLIAMFLALLPVLQFVSLVPYWRFWSSYWADLTVQLRMLQVCLIGFLTLEGIVPLVTNGQSKKQFEFSTIILLITSGVAIFSVQLYRYVVFELYDR